MLPKIIVIAGPTASGKTGIGIECAKRFNGEIISADSMQIYKGMNINTAKVTEQEQDGIVHHMLDVVDPSSEYSVSEYRDHARKIIDDIIARGKTPIIVGGTGLYIRGIIYDYEFTNSQKNEAIRQKYEQVLSEHGSEYLHNLLKQVDPQSAEEIHPNNTKRVIRALEIFDTTGNQKSSLKREPTKVYDYALIVLDMPRDTLYERINLRVDLMIKDGALQEAKHFIDTVPTDAQSMQAIGYKEFAPYFKGEKTLGQVTDDLKQATRNYAKRQITYFKGFADAHWINPLTQKQQIFDIIEEKLK